MADERLPAPHKRQPAKRAAPVPKDIEVVKVEVPAPRHRLASGFASVREVLSYALGTGVLLYGILGAAADRQLVVVSAGLALLGLPIVGGIFSGQGKDAAK